ncbi:hypothetical protein MEO41_28545, partial [Dolichospermum sp. ST_sed4]|nr:hypothetical protein [Dolichospermum sp. ST_sed4]
LIDDLVEEEGSSIESLEQVDEVVAEEVVEDIPEKFRGKSAKDIADSYINLEKEYGRKAQEIGELRKLTDQILTQQIATNKEPDKQEPVDDADFFVDPQKAVERAIANHPKIKQYEEQPLQAQ